DSNKSVISLYKKSYRPAFRVAKYIKELFKEKSFVTVHWEVAKKNQAHACLAIFERIKSVRKLNLSVSSCALNVWKLIGSSSQIVKRV
ncbi:hypothetical protein L9F63_017355, partial [Diploptera punctata]